MQHHLTVCLSLPAGPVAWLRPSRQRILHFASHGRAMWTETLLTQLGPAISHAPFAIFVTLSVLFLCGPQAECTIRNYYFFFLFFFFSWILLAWYHGVAQTLTWRILASNINTELHFSFSYDLTELHGIFCSNRSHILERNRVIEYYISVHPQLISFSHTQSPAHA